MLINIEYKTKNFYTIGKMTHFTPCGVKWVSDHFLPLGLGKKYLLIDFIPESKASIYNVLMEMLKCNLLGF